MDECIESLGPAKIFLTLDSNSGYWKIDVREANMDKTFFVMHNEMYGYSRLPFAL